MGPGRRDRAGVPIAALRSREKAACDTHATDSRCHEGAGASRELWA